MLLNVNIFIYQTRFEFDLLPIDNKENRKKQFRRQ